MLLTIRDVAQELQVKPSTLYMWVAQRRIPSIRLNGMIRFQREALDQWVNACREDQRQVPTTIPSVSPRGGSDLDSVIERAKREAYSSPPGDQTTKKGGRYGTL